MMNMEAFWGTAVVGFLVAFLPASELWLEQLLGYISRLVMSWRFVIYDVEQATADHIHQADESMQAVMATTPNQLFDAVQLHLGEKLNQQILLNNNIYNKTKSDAEKEEKSEKDKWRLPWSRWLEPQPVVKVGMAKGDSKLTFTLAPGQYVDDTFRGKRLRWHAEEKKPAGAAPMITGWDFFHRKRDLAEARLFRLRLLVSRRDDAEGIAYPYLQHIVERSSSIAKTKKQRLLYTNLKSSDYESWAGRRHLWASVPFRHPGTFDTLAIDPRLKERIIQDLVDFSDASEFYRKAGRAWKRGYLLYGPPGTGKSTLIAAIANFMDYDVYDLELSQVRHNGHLKNLLVKTSNKSVVVIEDIDCALTDTTRAVDNHTNRTKVINGDGASSDDEDDHRPSGHRLKVSTRLTFSGLLNFTDGLWSSCGGERIFIFTTNHPERLDPALLRPGRMDMHIHLSHCTYEAFKVLAKNYLGLKDHKLFKKVEMAMGAKGAQMTPAQVCELLTRDRTHPQKALQNLIAELENQLSGKSSDLQYSL